ncbi:GNAT family N-acetyltransferase [Craterilacuibacter sp. RT1T]|uniref:GNAT family N-acetyltransferase n=1 Tax=Craterilacuibacter sp. RT1T TaxID=2942211 RepID=UPI0020C16206|nr:GNAT family N-acetyltransferase [Craterilacuibacter sp. RT1T]MCL6263709.1 GNAT family N-acetyltransferase [Craterilacuibacter sp. RT1T]
MFLLETPHLRLTELGASDAGFLVELLNSPTFLQHIGDKKVRSVDDALRYLAEGPAASYALHGYGLWRVALKKDDTAIGICGLVRRDVLPAPDIGFALLPAYAGQGYGYEAARACRDHAFEVLGLPRVLGITDDANLASKALLEKLGLSFTHYAALYEGEPPLRVYALAQPKVA